MTSLVSLVLYLFAVTSILPSNVCAEAVNPQKENYEPDYSFYHNLTRIVAEIKTIVNRYCEYIQEVGEFLSRAGRPQLVLRISNLTRESKKNNKAKILFAFGEHAREFFPVESLFYFLKNLTIGFQEKNVGTAYSSWVVNNFDIYIIAMANPDGRNYIELTKNYCWRGTSSGIDLNRNFDWNFGGNGSSQDPSDEEYRGPSALSEPETLVFSQLASHVNLDGFISFHSGVRQIFIPFSDTKSKQQQRVPQNKDNLLTLARLMSRSSPKHWFQFGQAYQLIQYTADGTSFDYMAGAFGVPFSLAVELWQHEKHVGPSCFDEFNPPSENLQEEVVLVHPLYVELLLFLYEWKRKTTTASLQVGATSAGFESFPVSLALTLAVILCVVLAARQVRHAIRRKRVVSLKSLSSTFSMYKTV